MDTQQATLRWIEKSASVEAETDSYWFECTPTGSVTSLSVNGKQVLVQYSDRLTLYNQQLDEIKSVEQNLLGVRRSVLLRRGAALLVSGSSAAVLAF